MKFRLHSFSTNSFKNGVFTILRPNLLQLRYMESDRNIIIAAPTAFNDIQTIVDRTIVGMANN